MVNSVDFSKRLEKILDYYGLSATAFSEKIDFNRSTISHLISGRNKPSLEFVMKVVHTFEEVNLYWLLNGKGTFPSTAEIEQKEIKLSANSQATEAVAPSEKSTHKNSDASVPLLESDKNVSANSVLRSSSTSSSIDCIIIFYTNGSFKEYLP
jgi:plasmid maintenance system antidote protein VapI